MPADIFFARTPTATDFFNSSQPAPHENSPYQHQLTQNVPSNLYQTVPNEISSYQRQLIQNVMDEAIAGLQRDQGRLKSLPPSLGNAYVGGVNWVDLGKKICRLELRESLREFGEACFKAGNNIDSILSTGRIELLPLFLPAGTVQMACELGRKRMEFQAEVIAIQAYFHFFNFKHAVFSGEISPPTAKVTWNMIKERKIKLNGYNIFCGTFLENYIAFHQFENYHLLTSTTRFLENTPVVKYVYSPLKNYALNVANEIEVVNFKLFEHKLLELTAKEIMVLFKEKLKTSYTDELIKKSAEFEQAVVGFKLADEKKIAKSCVKMAAYYSQDLWNDIEEEHPLHKLFDEIQSRTFRFLDR